MATLPELLAQAEIIRTAQNVDENTAQRIGKLYNDIIVYFSNNGGTGGVTSHPALNDKNAETDYQHVDTTTTKETLVNDDKVTIYDSLTGKVVLTDKTNVGVQSTEDILYADLLVLINNNELIPNSSYRITDYTTTTAQVDTTSAGHDFDIIVTALSTNELSEIASCVRKSGDTYFTNAKLEAWEIKYCINNDTTKFAWADNVNGKGVIYYMKDEWNNECPYDFKNIQFKKSDVFLYTFGGATDNSLTGGCHHNIMMDYVSSSVLTLNFNTFGIGCYSNTFDNDCHSNTFGNTCYSNTFSIKCDTNTFGNDCYYNTFGNGFDDNTFGNNCYSNTFGDKCDTNTFGDNCSYNTFGDNCDSNTFGNGCNSNTFGNNCFGNKFGNYCNSNTFGNECSYNNFYSGASGATKKDYIRYIVLEDGCKRNNFYSSIITDDSNYLQRIRIKGLEHNIPTNIQITLPTTNNNYEWVICYASDGILKQYYSGDITEEINKLLPLIYAGL